MDDPWDGGYKCFRNELLELPYNMYGQEYALAVAVWYRSML